MNQDGEPMSQWLKKIEKDQNLSKLGDLVKTLKDGLGKKWFVRQDIGPGIEVAQYNSISGRYEFSRGQHAYATNAANAATSVLTCAAGEEWIVYQLQRDNDTRVATYQLDAVIGGVALALIPDDAVAMGAIGEPRHFILAGGTYFDSAGNGRLCVDMVVLRGGDTLTVTDTSWVAADGQTTIWRYYRRVVS